MSRPALTAARCLLKAGSFPAEPLGMLRRCRGVWLYTVEEACRWLPALPTLPPECDARTYAFRLRGGGIRWILCYRADAGAGRVRFSLAHELGHIALRHPEAGPREEAEANAFASALLVPPPLLALAQERAALTPALVSAVFGVSAAMAAAALSRREAPLPEETAAALREAFGGQVLARLGELRGAGLCPGG